MYHTLGHVLAEKILVQDHKPFPLSNLPFVHQLVHIGTPSACLPIHNIISMSYNSSQSHYTIDVPVCRRVVVVSSSNNLCKDKNIFHPHLDDFFQRRIMRTIPRISHMQGSCDLCSSNFNPSN